MNRTASRPCRPPDVRDRPPRSIKAQRYADGDTTTIGEYRYLADNRRASKVVSHAGVEAVAGDGGNTTVHYYYSSGWQICEARNGSNQATRQWVWGTQYEDEPLLMDVNGEPGTNNTCDPDVTDFTSIKDRRYYYQQDRNWNVVALLEADDTQGTSGRCVERYAYTPYGEFLVLKGENASGNLGNALVASRVGNPFMHQGLPFDQEKASYQNRQRECPAGVQRFAQRDPLPRQAVWPADQAGGGYVYVEGKPSRSVDPSGLAPLQGCDRGERGPAGQALIDGCSCITEAWLAAQQDAGSPAQCIMSALGCMKGKCDSPTPPQVHCDHCSPCCLFHTCTAHAVSCYLGLGNHVTLCSWWIGQATPPELGGSVAHEIGHCCGLLDQGWPGAPPGCTAQDVAMYISAHGSCVSW